MLVSEGVELKEAEDYAQVNHNNDKSLFLHYYYKLSLKISNYGPNLTTLTAIS